MASTFFSVGALDFLQKLCYDFSVSSQLSLYSEEELANSYSWWGLYYVQLDIPLTEFRDILEENYQIKTIVVDNLNREGEYLMIFKEKKNEFWKKKKNSIVISPGYFPCITSKAERMQIEGKAKWKWYHMILEAKERIQLVKLIAKIQKHTIKTEVVVDLFKKQSLRIEMSESFANNKKRSSEEMENGESIPDSPKRQKLEKTSQLLPYQNQLSHCLSNGKVLNLTEHPILYRDRSKPQSLPLSILPSEEFSVLRAKTPETESIKVEANGIDIEISTYPEFIEPTFWDEEKMKNHIILCSSITAKVVPNNFEGIVLVPGSGPEDCKREGGNIKEIYRFLLHNHKKNEYTI